MAPLAVESTRTSSTSQILGAPRIRAAAVALTMMPAWMSYLVALTGWLNADVVDPETLRLGMNVEYVSCILFPILCALAADVRPPRGARIVLCVAFAAAVSAFIARGLGWDGVTLFWSSGIVTYAGWLFAMPDQARVRALMSRMLLTVGCLIPMIFVVIVLAAVTGAEMVLLLGFLYFLTLQVLEISGVFVRFERRFSALA